MQAELNIGLNQAMIQLTQTDFARSQWTKQLLQFLSLALKPQDCSSLI